MRKTMSKTNESSYSGFTFMEVMIAMAIVSIAVMGILKMLAAAQARNFRSWETTNAMVAIQEVTETLQSYDYDGPELVDTTNGSPREFIVSNGRSAYTVSYTVTDGSWAANTPMPMSKRVYFRVVYAAANFRQRIHVESEIILAEFGKR
ncbi:MAG: type II secretion system protein [Desulfobacterales bacterium]|nr:type II secretion system protein [Desulfobacterales bacterium]